MIQFLQSVNETNSKGKKPKVNIGSELDDAQGGFKVTLQKPSKIKSGLDKYVVGQENAKKAISVAYIITTKELFIRAICKM